MKSIAACLMAIAVVLTSACASGIPYREMQIPPVNPEQGRVFFYRTAVVGAAIQPEVRLNSSPVGKSVPQGFFYVDLAPQNCEVATSTEVENKLTFVLDKGQTRYVRLDVSMGLFVGHIVPRLIDESTGAAEIQDTKFTGPVAGQ